jgi:hypothetical protein
MSAVKTNKVQIGQSATPGNNITIETPAVPDGSFSIRKGTHDGSGVVLLNVDAAGNPTFPTQPPRTWQDVKASRALATPYTNSTGRDIDVSVTAVLATSGTITITVNGVVASQCSYGGSGNLGGNVIATIPPGASYTVTSSAAISIWAELRP